jgi:hypothetical protein
MPAPKDRPVAIRKVAVIQARTLSVGQTRKLLRCREEFIGNLRSPLPHSSSARAYQAPLRQALIDDNTEHVNIVVCEADYKALKRGIQHLPPAVQ